MYGTQAEDDSGRLAISFHGPGGLLVDVVSVMPEDNALKGGAMNPWPFREDLMQRMRDLKPRRVCVALTQPVTDPCTCIDPHKAGHVLNKHTFTY